MNKPKDGGPAFPTNEFAKGMRFGGMTLRQWYAGQALAGFVASKISWHDDSAQIAGYCFIVADAMIAYEEKEAQ